MAYYFSPASRILRFAEGARPEHWVTQRQGDQRGQLWIAVPGLAWTIQAQLRAVGPLNALQRAVLTLCHMGIVQAEHQAEATGLDRDLVGFVARELMGEELVTAHGELTEPGLKALQEDRDLPVRTVQLHVFQDPWSGELWPRAVKRMEVAATIGDREGFDRDMGARQWPRLDMSSPGRDRNVPVTFVNAPNFAVDVPSLRAIGAAIEMWVASKHGSGDQLALAGKAEEAIEISDDAAEPVWIVTQVYVPDDETFDRRWRVTDPFALGDLGWLRRRLREIATLGRGNAMLLAALSRLVGQEDGAAVEGEAEELRVLDQFGVDLNDHLDLKEAIENLLAAKSTLTGADEDKRHVQRAANSAAISCGKALEYILPRLLEVFPVLGGSRRAHEVLIQGVSDVGWGVCPKAWANESNLLQSRDLVALLARTAVAAIQHCNHPLRLWMQRGRTATHLDQLRTWRNDHSHLRQGKRSTLTKLDQGHRIVAALELIEILLPSLPKERANV